jgi:hypothetical protein
MPNNQLTTRTRRVNRRPSRVAPVPRGVPARGNLPQYSAIFQQAYKTMRFDVPANPSNPYVISTLDLFNLLLVGDGSNSAYPIISALRLRKVRMYAVQQVIGNTFTPAYVSVEFSISNTPGNVGIKPTTHSDKSLSQAIPAQLSVKPPPNSSCSMWQFRPGPAATGGTAIIFNSSPNAVIDIIMDYVLQNGETPPGKVTTNAAATAGVVFLNTLDNSTTDVITPSPEYANGN